MAKKKRPRITLPKVRGPSTPDQVVKAKDVYCEALRQGYAPSEAGEIAKVHPTTVNHWKLNDFQFARAVGAAQAFGAEPYEKKYLKNVFEGVDKVLTHQGRITVVVDEDTGLEVPVTVKEFDLNAQDRAMRALMPEKYDPAIRAKVWERNHAPEQAGKANVEDIATLAGLLAKVATAKAATVDPDEDEATE